MRAEQEANSRRDKSAGHLISFAQFAFIAAEGFLQQYDFVSFRLRPRVIPLLVYFRLVCLFFAATVLNNIALNYHISIPVHTVFRSSGLAGTLLTGFLFYKKKYSLYQVVSCLLVCGGIVLLTLADAGARTLPGCCDTPSIPLQTKVQAAHHAASDSYDASNSTSILALLSPTWLSSLHAGPLLSSLLSLDLFGSTDLRWLVGILMLTLTLFLLAFLGHEQERVYARYGKVWREVMFYQHLVSLPFCMVMGKDIWTHVVDWMKPQTYASVAVPFIGEMRVSLFAFLALNLLTQTVCFKGVSMLTAHCGALTIALALTVRKFLSLLLSILYFNNQFTQRHWSGAILVFIGIGAYTNEQSCRRLWERIGGGSNSSGAKATIAAAQADSLKLTNGVGSHASLSPSSTVELPSELDLLASPNALAVAKSTSPDGMRSRAAASKRAASPRRKSSSGGAVDRSSSSKKKTSTRTRSSSQRS